MASEPVRDPAKDHLLTPKNSALIIIDYQPVQLARATNFLPVPVSPKSRTVEPLGATVSTRAVARCHWYFCYGAFRTMAERVGFDH
jgi:hypothetical protein